MWQLLKTINQHLVTAIPAMMLLGFGYGLVFDPTILKSLIVPLTFVMVYPMMVTLKIKEVLAGGDTRAQLLAQLINFGIVPFAAFGVGVYFLRDQPYMALGLLLAGLVPTSGMTISWTGLARGNMAAAVKMTVDRSHAGVAGHTAVCPVSARRPDRGQHGRRPAPDSPDRLPAHGRRFRHPAADR
jgi:ACR3 family arsenite transporter